jgi:hypothetical protein
LSETPGGDSRVGFAADRERLLTTVSSLNEKLGIKASVPKLMAVLQEFPCQVRTKNELAKPTYAAIDQYYALRHDYLRRLIMDALVLALQNNGYRISLYAENRTAFGTGDVDLRVRDSIIELTSQTVRVRIEVKGGNFSIDQIARYLLDADHVVVCLAGRGSAFTISRADVEQLLSFTAPLYRRKAEMLPTIDDIKDRIPGPWCRGCRVSCPHALPEHVHQTNLDKEFVKAAKTWAAAIEDTVRRTVSLLGEINREQLTNGSKVVLTVEPMPLVGKDKAAWEKFKKKRDLEHKKELGGAEPAADFPSSGDEDESNA